MLVHDSRRHHRPADLQLSFSSSTTTTNPLPLDYSSPAPSTFDSPNYLQTSDRPFHSRQSTPSDHFALPPRASQYMTASLPQNPPIRVQSSTPNQRVSQPAYEAPSSMLGNYSASGSEWDFANAYHLSPRDQHQHYLPSYRAHKRFSSGSSIGSTGPDSPYTQTYGSPYIVDSESVTGASPRLEAFDSAFVFPKSASAPAQGTNNGFFAPAFEGYNPSTYNADTLMATQAAMKQALVGHGGNTSANGEISDMPYGEGCNGSAENPSNVPKFSRTVTDAYQDELYQPSLAQTAPVAAARSQHAAANQQSHLLSPFKNVFSERLQEANRARSASPSSSTISRDKSPFRENSVYASDGFSGVASNPHSPATRLNSAARMREQAKAESDAIALAQHQPRNDDLVPPKTISPKEVSLDYNEPDEDANANMPLFPHQEQRQKRPKQSAIGNLKHEVFDNNNQAVANQHDTSNYPSSTASSQTTTTTAGAANYTFMPPSVPTSQVPQQYPFMARRQSSLRSTSDQVPEFPAHLASMESTKSESSQPERFYQGNMHGLPLSTDSSQQSSQQSPPSSSPMIQRPADTTASAGTYTCTAPSCSARFDTAAKLHKHRRDAHPSSPPRTPSTPYAPSSATHTPTSATFPSSSTGAPSRNQQSGPHKCERINPSTGKPCNTVFSRTYDLTRHEDTIHNNRKQKVRCRLCTEEKTFSRNDALTRHMRVVHPEVDFPGKKGRRGG